ncbi:MAG: hypothetical protein DRI01_07155 [Chloroflexi bacterium]|nr:MAG: hypothetical protein DRI01_07155 [Chloroflexota bacterium]
MVATTLAYVLKRWADEVNAVEGVKVLYMPEVSVLAVPEGIRRLHLKTINGTRLFEGGEPVLVFARDVITHSDSPQPKTLKLRTEVSESTYTSDLFKARIAKCVLRCVYVSKDWKKVEEFELKYVTGAGVSRLKKLSVDFGEPVGELCYSVDWGELEGVEVTSEGLDTKGLMFSCTLAGPFVYGPVETLPVITEINAFYKDYVSGIVIETEVIKA